MSLDAVYISILLPALVAGILVTATHVPLGTQVLARGIVFIDLAIAQIAGCGVLLADRFGLEAQGFAVQVAALVAALAGALLLTWTERRWPDVQEAVIGVGFVLAASGGGLRARVAAVDGARPSERPGDRVGAGGFVARLVCVRRRAPGQEARAFNRGAQRLNRFTGIQPAPCCV